MTTPEPKPSNTKKYVLIGCLGFLLLIAGGCGLLTVAGLMGASHVASEVKKEMDQADAEAIKLSEFASLKNGMTYKQVVKILGKEGTPTGDNELAGYKTEMYSWENSNASNIQCMFQNGKLMQKNQFGLK